MLVATSMFACVVWLSHNPDAIGWIAVGMSIGTVTCVPILYLYHLIIKRLDR